MQRTTFGAAVLAAILTGCSTSDTTAPGSGDGPFSQAEARAVADEMQDEVNALVDGASVTDILVPSLSLSPGVRGVVAGPIIFMPRLGCPTPSEIPPTDTDQDGVPDNLTLTFDPALCTFTTRDGHVVHVLSGAVTISDPSSEDRGLHLSWADLEARTTIDETVFFLRRIAGEWQQIKSATGFSLTDQTTVTHESSEWPASQLVKDWQVDFVADGGVTFSHHWRLPSGTLTIDGSTDRTRNGVTKSLSVVTTTPLHFDSNCAARPRIDAGVLVIQHTGPQGTSTVTIEFTGCGAEPIITVS
jgi:hypothetical protein